MSAIRPSQFDLSKDAGSDGSTLQLRGVVDENTELPALDALDDISVIDLSQVTRVNGAGFLRLLRLRLKSGFRIRFCGSSSGSSMSTAHFLNTSVS